MPVPGRANNLLHIGVAGIPTQNFSSFFTGRDKLCRVTSAAGTHFHLDVLARGFFSGFNHFLYGEALTIAQVKDIAVAALAQIFERQYNRRGQ